MTNKDRIVILVLNIVAAYLVFAWITGQFVPDGGLQAVWLVAIISLWLLNLLSTPFFIPPRDAVIAGVGSAIMLATMDFDSSILLNQLNVLRWVFVGYAVLVIIMAVSATLLHQADERSPTARFFYQLTNGFGRGEVLFSAPAFLAVAGSYYDQPLALSMLLLAWIIFVTLKPVELLYTTFASQKDHKDEYSSKPTVGSVERVDDPNIVRVRLTRPSDWKAQCLYTASLPDGEQRHVFGLYHQLQGSEVVGTGMLVGAALSQHYTMPQGTVVKTDNVDSRRDLISELSGASDSEVAGFIVENSSISTVRFEVSPNISLKKGDVVFSRLDETDIFYQILDAETSEENFDKNPRGTHIVVATQLGIYDPDSGFTKFDWLPDMNSLLFLVRGREFTELKLEDDEIAIGKIPSSNIDVGVSIDDLVEYHSAVLGITGTGKTEVVLNVVREATQRGVRVICVDFTGDYKQRLADLNPEFPSPTEEQADDLAKKLFDFDTGTYGAKEELKILEEFIDELRETVGEQVQIFFDQSATNLAILELAEIANTKATLRLTELYLWTIMEWAKANRKKEKVLIVLEEAHTTIPETYGSGFDAATKWVVDRIGQIALQGRKYGVGLMVVSQRTALVSKTILSQCNTFFTHALIDQTSLTFLQSVYSSQHTKLIPNLGKFQLLAFGKAVKSERPVIVEREFDPAIKQQSDDLK